MRPRPLLQEPCAAGGVRRPALCQEESRPLSGGATPLPLEATPCHEKLLLQASRGSAPLRRLLCQPSSEARPRLPRPRSLSSFETAWVLRNPSSPGARLLRPRPSLSHSHCHSRLLLGSALWIPGAPPPAVNSPTLLSAAAPPLLARVQQEPAVPALDRKS